MDKIKTMDLAAYTAWLAEEPEPHQQSYYAMYSSILDAIVVDPRCMSIPADDHLAHRGDGVFETLRCDGGAIYNLGQHQARLEKSAKRIGIALPFSLEEIEQRIIATVRAGGQKDCLVRVLLSRGPGGFSVNPYESIGAQLYIIAYATKPPFMETHPGGASVAISKVPVKPPFFASIKTCNYLPNAMMKKDSVDQGVDFSVGLDDEGYITEGPTENLCIITTEGTLVRPPNEHMLNGTTMQRGFDLAAGESIQVEVRRFTPEEVREAAEVLIFGTSTDVTAVTKFEGQAIGDGSPGPVWKKLSALLAEEIASNEKYRTPVS